MVNTWWRYYVCCLLVGILLAQRFEAWESEQEYPPVALCPNYDEMRVSVNEWRLGSPVRPVTPTCETL